MEGRLEARRCIVERVRNPEELGKNHRELSTAGTRLAASKLSVATVPYVHACVYRYSMHARGNSEWV